MKFSHFVLINTFSAAAGTPFNLRRRAQATTCPDACAISEDISGVTACVKGFNVCINPEDNETAYTCGMCARVEAPEEIRAQEPLFGIELPLCSDVDLEDFACPLGDDGSMGALVCQFGFTTCVATSEVEDEDSCGCCAGDESARCDAIAAAIDAKTNEDTPSCPKELACTLPDGTMGSNVCRHGFTACIPSELLEESDSCGICPKVEAPEEIRVNPADWSLLEVPPICSDVDLANFACSLGDGATGALVCHDGFTACLSTEDIEADDTCGCCPGDNSQRCQPAEDVRVSGFDSIFGGSLVCSEAQLIANSCNMTDGSIGATVCRHGFTACMAPEDHQTGDACGECPKVELPEEPRVDPANLFGWEDRPCTEEMIAEFDCTLEDGSVGVYICKHGFTSCVAIDDLNESDYCGCCFGDDHKGCKSTTATTRSFNPDVVFP